MAPKPGDNAAQNVLTSQDARAIAKEAYIYGFPMAVNYQTMYKQAIDKASPDYKGTFNTLNSSKSVATPRRQVRRHPQLRHAVLLPLDGPPRRARRHHHAEDRAHSLLHGPDGRSLHLQLRLSRHPRLWQRRRDLPRRRPRLERSNTRGRQGRHSLRDPVRLRPLPHAALQHGRPAKRQQDPVPVPGPAA